MNNQQQNSNNYGYPQQPSTRKSLYLIAYIFNLICTVILGILIIPLLWCIPATIASKRAYNECDTPQEVSHIGLGVVSLLLVSGIGGVFILVASATKPEPVIVYQQNQSSDFNSPNDANSNGR
ncbi:hypothetical protein CXP39_01670 [Mesoplasma syrphidae]|uniref:Uncharacterized protein n=1 Tax=Mesoplasma syrphidae TaxID=225999 RepID=A0A2K9BUW1_9MOLU|nr:hypothetical protein [Mesoplasma syrphidae]AUF83500.1 hypothetical protein CXP39_01670 [Mesoplasma syrphidae]